MIFGWEVWNVAMNEERRRLVVVVSVAAAAVVLVAVGAAAVGWLSDGGDSTVVTQEPAGPDEDADSGDDDAAEDDVSDEETTDAPAVAQGEFLPEPMGGQAAIDALSDEQLEAVAKLNDRTAEELRDLLLRDATVKISTSGFLFYGDTATPQPPDD